MIKLQQIKFQASRSISFNSPKHIRISLRHITRNTTIPSKSPNQNCLFWSEQLYLPILYGQQFSFEIYNEHKFGYNPEQFEMILYGKIMISDRKMKEGVWQVEYLSEKIGYLTAKISCTPNIHSQFEQITQRFNKSQQIESVPREIKIKSIVASIAEIVGNSVLIQLKMGDHVIKEIRKDKCPTSQIIYLDEINFYKPLTQYFLGFKVYINKNNSHSKEKILVGSGSLIFSTSNKKMYNQSVALSASSESSQKIGEIFIKYTSTVIPQSKISLIGNKSIEKYNQKFQDHSSSLLKTRINIQQETEIEAMYQSKVKPKPYQKVTFESQNISLQESRRKYQSQMLPNQRRSQIDTLNSSLTKSIDGVKHHKQISVVSPNKDIIFGKAHRFPEKKPFTEFKYNINRTFDFRTDNLDETVLFESRAKQMTGNLTRKRYYRGASIGIGYKTDFTKINQKSPGVGSYQLPTIWDRY